MITRPPSRTAFKSLCTLLVVGASSSLLHARFAPPELKDIPLERLIANIDAKVKKSPDDAQAHHHLARVHAMAFVKGLGDDDKVELNARYGDDMIWFGYVPPHVPYAPRPTKPDGIGTVEKREGAALKHLDRAISEYERALELKPEDPLVVKLGLAWCRSQAGDTEKAAAGLRDVIETAWAKEGSAKFGGLNEFVTAEAASYLLPLLDPKDDADEIAKLKKRVKHLKSLPRPITPIAIPLRDGLDAAEMVDANASVAFDLDGSGMSDRRWQWLRPDNAAWLVHDPRGAGEIRSGIQMFGNRSFTMFFEHGYEALALLDDNGDGSLRGAELGGLSLWNDRNSDGRSDAGEVTPLASAGIIGLACGSRVDDDGVRQSRDGVLYEDGSRRTSYDLVLEGEAL